MIYGAFADGAATTTGLPLSAPCAGVMPRPWPTALPIAAGVLGRGLRNPGRAAALRSLALAGVVASVFGVGAVLCHGRSASHVVIFNLLLMAICVVIAGNLGNRPNSSFAALADIESNTVYCEAKAA